MNTNNSGKYIVGTVDQYAKRKGWFFGHFADNPLLQSDNVEVAWQTISGKRSSSGDKHLHSSSVEINIVIHGKVSLTLNGKEFTFSKKDFWIVWPQITVDRVRAGVDTEVLVIRSPSVYDKKVL